MKIAVAGGTGVVGRHVTDAALGRGHDVEVLARSTGVDLISGKALAGRLDGADCVIDVTSVATAGTKPARRFFGAVTEHLLAEEKRAGVGHHLTLSIVGIDDVPYGYYRGKAAQEERVIAGGVPSTILRATQFHEFAEQILSMAAVGSFSAVPRMLSQPVAAVEVAQHLVDLAESGPAGRVPDLAGPEKLQMVDLARRVNETCHKGRRIVPVRLPGAAGRGFRSGALTPSGDGPRGSITFDAWLTAC